MSKPSHNLVVVHPLVLLSCVDHYTRIAPSAKQRVVGVLLGTTHNGRADVTNSYAVPFEEHARTPNIWFLDNDFHETMWSMFRKVNASEKIIGWYSSGPKIRPADLDIHELFRKYCPHPVFVIVDVNPTETGIPTQAYVSIEEITEDGKVENRFQHLPSVIGALEAEEVGVEHLLRDVKDTNISTLATKINDKISSLKSLISRLIEMNQYLDNVQNNKLPVNNTIIRQIQEIFNLLPNLKDKNLQKSFMIKTNDNMLSIYLASLIRSVTALHDLINNKLEFRVAEGESEKDEDNNKNGEKKDTEKKDDKTTSDQKEASSDKK